MSITAGRICAALILGLTSVVLAVSAGCAGSGGFADGSVGSRLYRSRCRSCHSLINPVSKDLEWWKINLDKYAQRAHLTPTERDSVMAFVERAVAEAAKPE